jgi:hypothetical protein
MVPMTAGWKSGNTAEMLVSGKRERTTSARTLR